MTGPGREYASTADFCSLFKAETNRFYFLCRLLNENAEMAEQCFARSLENCLHSHRVFKDWAQRWATHSIIKTAIQMNSPLRAEPNGQVNGSTRKQEMLVSVVETLTPLERFVYVMTVLERYPYQECATLLASNLREVRAARERALSKLATNPEMLRATQSLALRMTS